MPTGPPRMLETIVGWLIPPACREEVLGDLHERSQGFGPYLADVASTIPLVIVSRIRRTSNPAIRLLEAMGLYLSFVLAARGLDADFLKASTGLWRLAIPAAVAFLVLLLADAYANPRRHFPLKPVLQTVLASTFACLSQIVLSADAPHLGVPSRIMIWGGALGIVLVSTVRLLFPPINRKLSS